MATRIWKVRIPVPLWEDLVVSGRLLKLVHDEIERGMWHHGYVKIRHGKRWVWLSTKELDAAQKAALKRAAGP